MYVFLVSVQALYLTSHLPGPLDHSFFFFFSFLFSFPELRTEPRALRLPGKRSTTELNPQPWITFYITLWYKHMQLCQNPLF
ncbi:rCG63521 [Rattus norvegicus]|uniref:RCG63521 n=1 Tax=Rattus norvegicus TaxID=10116 RepID=A6IV02_RAT|nr:rCG63521 [Rattus norvegicus]